MKRVEVFFKTGIWIAPIVFVGLHNTIFADDIASRLGISVLPSFFILAKYLETKRGDGGRKKAMHPPVTRDMVFKKPVTFVVGKLKKSGLFAKKTRYVCLDLNSPGAKHVFIVGGTGTGKSIIVRKSK